MSQMRERQPAAPARSGVAVQPASEVVEAAPEWLVEQEHISQAERLDRLAADQELINDLALAGFEGDDWDYFSTELARYGMAVIGGWMRRRLIFGRCRDRGFGGLPEMDRPFDPDEITELTSETVSEALSHFRSDVLMKHKWDYRKGASLRTYFIGQCLIRFANVYRRWWGNESRYRLLTTERAAAIVKMDEGRSQGPADQATAGVFAGDLLATVKDARVRKAMKLTAEGRTQAQIAVELQVTEKTVERMLSNERARLRKRMAG
ncbi:MAG TPA: hypothetical protein VF635_07575 [Propionibacteriaceae bacterium]|jgi:hypothetical protein